MQMKAEIDQKYRDIHDELGERYYQRQEISKEDFDRLHGELWNNYEQELINAGLVVEPKLPRDLEAEIDELKTKVGKLEKSGEVTWIKQRQS